MKKELIKRLTSFLDKNPTLKGVPATDEQIAFAEKELKVKINKDYKEFIQTFGGSYVGLAIHAFINGKSIGNETIVDLTYNARKLFKKSKIFPLIKESLVISDDGSGNPVAIDSNSEVVLFDYDTEEKQVLSSSFEEFIENNFAEW